MLLMIAYAAVAYGIGFFRASKVEGSRLVFDRTFNAATFSSSVMIFLGIIYPEVLRAIGNLKPYLLFAALAGLGYSIRALWHD
jgi:hypothetical protein